MKTKEQKIDNMRRNIAAPIVTLFLYIVCNCKRYSAPGDRISMWFYSLASFQTTQKLNTKLQTTETCPWHFHLEDVEVERNGKKVDRCIDTVRWKWRRCIVEKVLIRKRNSNEIVQQNNNSPTAAAAAELTLHAERQKIIDKHFSRRRYVFDVAVTATLCALQGEF